MEQSTSQVYKNCQAIINGRYVGSMFKEKQKVWLDYHPNGNLIAKIHPRTEISMDNFLNTWDYIYEEDFTEIEEPEYKKNDIYDIIDQFLDETYKYDQPTSTEAAHARRLFNKLKTRFV